MEFNRLKLTMADHAHLEQWERGQPSSADRLRIRMCLDGRNVALATVVSDLNKLARTDTSHCEASGSGADRVYSWTTEPQCLEFGATLEDAVRASWDDLGTPAADDLAGRTDTGLDPAMVHLYLEEEGYRYRGRVASVAVITREIDRMIEAGL